MKSILLSRLYAPNFYHNPVHNTNERYLNIFVPLAIAKYSGEILLMSVYLIGEKYIQNKAAALDVPYGKGRVILLGFAFSTELSPMGLLSSCSIPCIMAPASRESFQTAINRQYIQHKFLIRVEDFEL